MATITRVTATVGRTVNLGNFNSLRLDVSYEAELAPEEEGKHREVTRGLYRAACEELERQALATLAAIEAQRDAIFATVPH